MPGDASGPNRGRGLAAVISAASLAALLACRGNGGFQVTQANPPESSGGSPAPDGPAKREPVLAGPSLAPAEARAIRTFLAAHPAWRIATDSDARASDDGDDVSRLYGVYHPFFVRGDIDDDGALDFVVAFVDRERKSPPAGFTVAAFCGDGRGGFRPPQVIESGIALESGDISIDRDSILITPDLSDDDTSRRYRWNSHRRRFEFVADEDSSPDRPPSSRI
jgi:hypothetical protein